MYICLNVKNSRVSYFFIVLPFTRSIFHANYQKINIKKHTEAYKPEYTQGSI